MIATMNRITDSTSAPASAAGAYPLSRARQSRWTTVLTAMAAATAVGGFLDPILGVDLTVHQGHDVLKIENLAITLASLAAGLLGWALLELLERRTRNGRRTWTACACMVFGISLLGPLGATTPEGSVGLISLHVVVAAILVAGLRSSSAKLGRSASEASEGVGFDD